MAAQVPTELPQQAASIAPLDEPVIPPTKPTKSIALIICSTRPGRVNPAILRYIKTLLPASASTDYDLVTVDLKAWDLPMFNESTIPAALDKANPTPGYATEHARQWSAEISKYAAYVFVTPQYNWSLPASVKNALDYLFYEWNGKCAFVISYGGHGGGKGKAALEYVLGALKIKVTTGLEMTINPREGMRIGERGGTDIDVTEGMIAKWAEAGVPGMVERAWGELEEALKGEKL
jgi:NAD(P)H-dependent FMN reductase